MHDAVAMGDGQGLDQHPAHPGHLAGWEWTTTLDPVLQVLGQRREDEDDVAAVVDDVEDRHDPGMGEARQDLRLPAETLAGDAHLLRRAGQRHPLGGHPAAVAVDGELHHRRAPATEQANDVVTHGAEL